MTSPFADRLFRIAFALAGCYNLAFGLWAGFWPASFFRLFNIPDPIYPQIWACLGMVVGVYGLLYLHASWRLQTAWAIIAVGLLGKVLGPLGMLLALGDEWPRRLGMVCIFNDVIWWLPFGLFLVRGTIVGRKLAGWAPWLCIGGHVLAIIMMAIVLRPGTLLQVDVSARAAHVATHARLWSIGWASWMGAAASLVGFYAWWGSRVARDVRELGQRVKLRPAVATLAVVVAGFGSVFDFAGEGLSILVLVELAQAQELGGFVAVERYATVLCAVVANGLYTLAGLMLMLTTRGLARWIRALMWATWIAGAAMCVAGAADHALAMAAATAVLFPLLIVWIAWMRVFWTPASGD